VQVFARSEKMLAKGGSITVERVVEKSGMTRRGLERRFRSVLGRSPLEEIRRMHIERAQVLLSQTMMPVKQIALQSGFANVAWFTTAFRQITGHSPTEWRLAFRKS
jgi:transcriptional regulator GlxA family with amidase domain